MAEGKAALIGFVAGGIVASGLFVLMLRRENTKSQRSARRKVFMKDEGLSPSFMHDAEPFSEEIFLGSCIHAVEWFSHSR